MKTCLNCSKEIFDTEGRRPKLYCSGNCRQKHFQTKIKAKRAPETKKPASSPKKEPEPEKQPKIAIQSKSFRPSRDFDALIRKTSDKLVLEDLKTELTLNEMVSAENKKAFTNRIDFKLKRLN